MNELFIFPTRGKVPLTPGGFKDALPESQWTGKESNEWAAPCGKINGIFVVDVDVKGGGLETASTIDWHNTLTIPTPSGGKHIYYAYEEKLEQFKNVVGLLPGIDIRSNGSYVCLYDEVRRELISAMPENVYNLLLDKTKERAKKDRSQALDPNSAAEIMEGGRNAYLTKHAGRMQRIGVLSVAALQEINERDCNPPLDDYEIDLIYNSVNRYLPESTPDEDEVPQPKTVWVGDLVKDMFSFLHDKEKTQGESSGIPALDALLGGRRLGELTVTMAEGKTGKNSWWHQQQVFMLNKGIPIAYASREISPATEVLPNLLTIKLGKNIYKQNVTEEEVMGAISDWKLAFSNGYGAYQGDELWEWLSDCVRHGVKYFFLDHLGYMTVDSEDFKVLGEFGRKLKTFTKTHQVSIDLIIQPKVRPSYKMGDKLVKADMDINMLRGGASLGQVLDSLITMDRLCDENGNLTNVVKIDLKRARSKLARTGTFFMSYDVNLMTFKECTDPSEASTPRPHEAPRVPNTGQKQANYGESKSGEFFDLKRGVKTMMSSITKAVPNHD